MPITTLNLSDVNNLPSDNFIKVFGNLIELHPAAAIGILKNKPFSQAIDISKAINNYLDALNINDKQKILELHTDLAGKLTKESYDEEKAAKLDEITDEEKTVLCKFNEVYKNKFGFPFVICAKENNLQSIITTIQNRICNQYEVEILKGIEEVKKIAKLRIFQIIIDT